MMKLFSDVKPGDRLFRAQRGHRMNDPLRMDWVVVTKVGRKWVEFMPDGAKSPHLSGRFRVDDGILDSNYGNGGAVHRSEDAFHADNDAREAWRQLHRHIANRFSMPAGLTAAEIEKAAELLKLDLSK